MSRRFRLLHIQKVTGICGSENHLLELIPRIDRTKYKITFLALVEPGKPMDEYLSKLEAAGIDAAQMIISHDISVSVIYRLWKFIRQGQYDLVHTHLLHADLYGGLAARLTGKKIVSSKHGCNKFRYGPIGLMDKLAAGWAGKVIAISDAVSSFYQAAEKIPAQKIEVIKYGFIPYELDSSSREEVRRSLGVSPETKVLINVGRLISLKAQGDAIKVLAKLKSYPVELWLVGDGPLRKKLEAQARDLGLQANVRFFGFRKDVPWLLQGADIFLFPSVSEGFGLVLLEAMSRKLPVVACNVTAVPEIVLDNETGFVVGPHDSRGLTVAVKKLLEDPELARQFGKEGYRRVVDVFSMQKMVSATEELYLRLLNEGNEANARKENAENIAPDCPFEHRRPSYSNNSSY